MQRALEASRVEDLIPYARNARTHSDAQVRMHPDVSKVIWRFGRWHHYVDYTPFKKTPLIRRSGINIPEGTNDYGMRLLKIK